MKRNWKNDLKREYSEKQLDIPVSHISGRDKKLMKIGKKALIAPICIILASLLVIGAVAVGFATDWFNAPFLEKNNIRIDTVPEGYTGIYTAEDLDNIRNDFSTNYILMKDIDLCGREWEPIGKDVSEKQGLGWYSGIFNGNGHIIKNFVINTDKSAAGLFERTTATFMNLGIEDCQINVNYTKIEEKPTGGSYHNGVFVPSYYEETAYGAIAGEALFVGACYAKDVKLNVTVSAEDAKYISVGGLVGNVSNIDSCYSDVEIKCNASNGVEPSLGKIAGTAISVLTSYSIGNGDQADKLACVEANKNVPMVLEKDVFEKMIAKVDEKYADNFFERARFSAYFLLVDKSLFHTDEGLRIIEEILRILNIYRNCYGKSDDELRPVYAFDPTATIDERIKVTNMLIEAFGSEEALRAFYEENNVRIGELYNYYFESADDFDVRKLTGFDTESIWKIQKEKISLRVFG